MLRVSSLRNARAAQRTGHREAACSSGLLAHTCCPVAPTRTVFRGFALFPRVSAQPGSVVPDITAVNGRPSSSGPPTIMMRIPTPWTEIENVCREAAASRRAVDPDDYFSPIVRHDLHVARELERLSLGWGTARFIGSPERAAFLSDLQSWLKCTSIFLGWNDAGAHGLVDALSQHTMALALARVQPAAGPVVADLEVRLPSRPDIINGKAWVGVRRILDPCIVTVAASLGKHVDAQFHWDVAHGDGDEASGGAIDAAGAAQPPLQAGGRNQSDLAHRPFRGIASLLPLIRCVAALPLLPISGPVSMTVTEGQRSIALRALGQAVAPAVRLWGKVDAPRSLARTDSPAAAARFATAFDLLWAFGGHRGLQSWAHPGAVAAVQRVDGALAAAISEGALERIAERFGLDAPPAIAAVVLAVHRRHAMRAPALAWALLPALRTEAHALLAAVSLHGDEPPELLPDGTASGFSTDVERSHVVSSKDSSGSRSGLHVGYLLARAEQLASACASLRQTDTVEGPIALAALRCASLLHRQITSNMRAAATGHEDGTVVGAAPVVGTDDATKQLLDHAARALGKAVIEVVHTGALRSRRAAPLLLSDVGVWLRECGAAAEAHLASCTGELNAVAAMQKPSEPLGLPLLRLLSLPLVVRSLFRLTAIANAGSFLAAGRHDAPAVVAAATAGARLRLFAAIHRASAGLTVTGPAVATQAGEAAANPNQTAATAAIDIAGEKATQLFARVHASVSSNTRKDKERYELERSAREERARLGVPGPEWDSLSVLNAVHLLHSMYLFGVAAKLLSPCTTSTEPAAQRRDGVASSTGEAMSSVACAGAADVTPYGGEFFPSWLARLVLAARAEFAGARPMVPLATAGTASDAAAGAASATATAGTVEAASAAGEPDRPLHLQSSSPPSYAHTPLPPVAQAVAEYVQGACAARGLPQPRTHVWVPELAVHVPIAWPAQRVAIVCFGPPQFERPPVEALAATDALTAAVARGLFPNLRAAQATRDAEMLAAAAGDQARVPVHMPGIFDLRSAEELETKHASKLAAVAEARAANQPTSREEAAEMVWDRDSPQRSIILSTVGARLPLDHLRGQELGPPLPRPQPRHHPEASLLERLHIIAPRQRSPPPPRMPAPVSPLQGSPWDGPLLPTPSLAVAALRGAGWHVLSVSANTLWCTRHRYGAATARGESSSSELSRATDTADPRSTVGAAGQEHASPALSAWEWDPPDPLRVMERVLREQGLWDILAITSAQKQARSAPADAQLQGGAGSASSDQASRDGSPAVSGQPHPWTVVRLSSVPGIPRPDAPRPPPLRQTNRRRHFSTCTVAAAAAGSGRSDRSGPRSSGDAGAAGAMIELGGTSPASVARRSTAGARASPRGSATGGIAAVTTRGGSMAQDAAGTTADADSGAGERIAKLLARAGVCSRRDAERLLAEGRISLSGAVLRDPATRLTEAQLADVLVDRQPVPQRQATRLWLYNKPIGLVTSHADELGRTTVFDALRQAQPELPRVLSVGRLDLNSEGLLLLTNDGALARALELPSSGISRVYRVLLQHGRAPPSDAALASLAAGVTVDAVDYAGIEATLERPGRRPNTSWLRLTLSEGKNREIRRVAEGALNCTVLRLQRISYGPFRLHPDLHPGHAVEVPREVVSSTVGSLLKGLGNSGAALPPLR